MKESETKTQNKPQSKGAKAIKVILNTVINVLIVIVLLVSLLIAVMALTSKSSGISTVFGYTIQPIQSDSMKGKSPDGYEGGDFEKGDLIIGKATGFDTAAEYKEGDIVTYKTVDVEGNEVLIVHRIVDVAEGSAGSSVYQTWGDNREVSEIPDQQDVSQYIEASEIASVFYDDAYHGTVLKGWGAPIDYLRTQQGFFLVVLLPMIIFFMYELIRVVLNASNYKKAKANEEKDEAVKAAVAEALASKASDETNGASNEAKSIPEGMTAEELEQFRQFQAFQKMQKAQQESADSNSDTSEVE